MPFPGEFAAIATACCWVASSLFFEGAGKRIGSLSLNVIRLTLATVFLAVGASLLRGTPLPLDIDATSSAWLAASGVLGLLIGDYCLFRALIEIGPRLSTLVMASVPLWVAALSFATAGEQLTAMQLLGVAMVVAGIAWAIVERPHPAPASSVPMQTSTALSRSHSAGVHAPAPRSGARAAASGAHEMDVARDMLQQTSAVPPPVGSLGAPPGRLVGLAFALGGALGQASGLVLSKHGMAGYDAIAATQIRIAAALVGFVLVCTVIGWWPKLRASLADLRALQLATGGAVFGPFVGVWLSLIAVQTASNAAVAATLMATTPVLMLGISWFRGERLGLGAIAGAGLAVGGVAILVLGRG